ARVREFELHHGRAGRGWRVEKGTDRTVRRLQRRDAGRRSGPDAANSQARFPNWLRRNRRRLDGSAADAAHAGEAKISLGIRHASMPLETSRRHVPSKVRSTRLCGDAERLDLSDYLSADLAGDGSASDLHVPVGFGGSHSTTFGLLVHEPAPDSFLLRAVSRG